MNDRDGRPRFAGAEDPVLVGDWVLVEWVAGAALGDPFPEPWRQAHDPLRTMLARLAELGVIAPPPAGDDGATIAREASAAAKRWLAQHPRPRAAAQVLPRHLGFRLAADLAPEALAGAAGQAGEPDEPEAVRMRRLVLERMGRAGGPGPTGA